MRTTEKYIFFWGTSSIYSNWHPSTFVINGVSYVNNEQYMMAAKARIFGDKDAEAKILALTASQQKEAKALGRAVKGYVEAVWVKHREKVMFDGCLAKFEQNPSLAKQLMDTGEKELVEASPYDRIWGIGLGENDPRVLDRTQWQGLNLLGIALMRVRESLLLSAPEALF